MLDLSEVQLITVRGGGAPIEQFAAALRYSMKSIHFGLVTLVSNERPKSLEGIEFREIEAMGLDGYNRFMLSKLEDYQKLPFLLVIQADSFVVHPEEWKAEFLEYDYIGAPWPAPEGQPCMQGNGGFSLRSRKLNRAAAVLAGLHQNSENEDAYICNTHRSKFEGLGCKFAPPELAAKFSIEFKTWHHDGSPTFGFHNFYNDQTAPYRALLNFEMNNV